MDNVLQNTQNRALSPSSRHGPRPHPALTTVLWSPDQDCVPEPPCLGGARLELAWSGICSRSGRASEAKRSRQPLPSECHQVGGHRWTRVFCWPSLWVQLFPQTSQLLTITGERLWVHLGNDSPWTRSAPFAVALLCTEASLPG